MDEPQTTGNPRYVLRAYESADSARLARAILSAGYTTLSRQALANIWAEQNPADATSTVTRTIRRRITRGAHLLAVAGIVDRRGELVVVLNRERLDMAARNLTILETPDGRPIQPDEWARRPEVPPHLRHVQHQLEHGRSRRYT